MLLFRVGYRDYAPIGVYIGKNLISLQSDAANTSLNPFIVNSIA